MHPQESCLLARPCNTRLEQVAHNASALGHPELHTAQHGCVLETRAGFSALGRALQAPTAALVALDWGDRRRKTQRLGRPLGLPPMPIPAGGGSKSARRARRQKWAFNSHGAAVVLPAASSDAQAAGAMGALQDQQRRMHCKPRPPRCSRAGSGLALGKVEGADGSSEDRVGPRPAGTGRRFGVSLCAFHRGQSSDREPTTLPAARRRSGACDMQKISTKPGVLGSGCCCIMIGLKWVCLGKFAHLLRRKHSTGEAWSQIPLHKTHAAPLFAVQKTCKLPRDSGTGIVSQSSACI